MSLAKNSLLLFVVFLLQMSTACESKFFEKICLKTLGSFENIAKTRKPAKMLNDSNSKLLSKDMSQFVGNFLKLNSAKKMKQISKQWSDVKIYENISPSEREVAVYRHVDTGEIMWKKSKCRKFGFWDIIMCRTTPLPNQEKLVSHLRRNDVAKWNDVFVWLAENDHELNKSQNASFLKELMLAVAQNVAVTFTAWFGYSPLIIAAKFDDVDSILTLIKRGANVYQRDYFGWTALHVAAQMSNINACAALLDAGTNVNVATRDGWTPLMRAGQKKMFEFLIEKGANKDLTTDKGETAAQLARFQKR